MFSVDSPQVLGNPPGEGFFALLFLPCCPQRRNTSKKTSSLHSQALKDSKRIASLGKLFQYLTILNAMKLFLMPNLTFFFFFCWILLLLYLPSATSPSDQVASGPHKLGSPHRGGGLRGSQLLL